jgi:hypothetical protein
MWTVGTFATIDESFWHGVAQMADGAGPTSHFCEKRFPLVTWPSAALPIGACIFAAMVEGLLILALERSDLPGDERVEIGELCCTSAGIVKSMRPLIADD